MLANILDTARRFLSRSPSVQSRSTPIHENSIAESLVQAQIQHEQQHEQDKMVTTRRGTETPGTEVGATPRSSGRKRGVKRDVDAAVESPSVVKRQRRTEPKRLEVQEVEQTVIEEEKSSVESVEPNQSKVVVTTTDVVMPVREESLPIRRRGSPMVIVPRRSSAGSTPAESVASKEELRDETQKNTPKTPQVPAEEAEPPRSGQDGRNSPTPVKRTAKNRASASAKPTGRKKKSPQNSSKQIPQSDSTDTALPEEIPSSTYESDQAPLSQNAPELPTPPQKAHIRFDSEEPAALTPTVIMNRKGYERYAAPESTPRQQPARRAAEADEDASDSDEAPEVVTTASAASKVTLAAQEAARAQRAQAEKNAAKREAREQRVAAEQAAKRDREAKQAKKLARKIAKQERAAAATSAEDNNDAATPLATLDRNNLPALLPASLLSTISAQRPPTPPPEQVGKTDAERKKEKLNHHIKFLERADKPVKDVQKGKLSVAVLGKQSNVLPPKVSKATRQIREKWLKGREEGGVKGKGKGRRIKLGKVERRAVGGGFLRGGD